MFHLRLQTLHLLVHKSASTRHDILVVIERIIIHGYGMAVDMGTAFDALSIASHPEHEAEHLQTGVLTPAHIANRNLLRNAMLGSGFEGIDSEWWHFDFGDRAQVRARYARID